MSGFKNPISALILIHTPALDVLLLERASHPGFWQSVTGSLEDGETARAAACRETAEETGITVPATQLHDWHLSNRYEIFHEWRHRYAPGTTHNLEHVFSLCVPTGTKVTVAAREHLGYCWCPWQEAAQRVFSWSNRDALLMLPQVFQVAPDVDPGADEAETTTRRAARHSGQ